MSQGSMFRLTNPEIYVLTANYAGKSGGQVATWVTLASLIPEAPRIVAILSPYTYTYSLIHQSQAFVVHMLSAEQNAWIEQFGLKSGHDINKFENIAVSYSDTGIPILPNTCGWATCKISQTLDLGDRILLVADVLSQSFDTNKFPLRRLEGLASLPESVTQALIQQRLADIKRDRPLRPGIPSQMD